MSKSIHVLRIKQNIIIIKIDWLIVFMNTECFWLAGEIVSYIVSLFDETCIW